MAMTNVNKAIICGRIGQDPNTGETRGGMRFLRFSVATDERWKDKASGEKKSITTWHRVCVWGNDRANGLSRILKKGSLVYVEGQMHHSEYTDKDGAKQRSFEIRVQGYSHKVELLDRAAGATDIPDNVQDVPDGAYDDADNYDRAAA